MIPEIAERLNAAYALGHEGDDMAADAVRAIAAGARDAGLEVLNMSELDDIAAEMSGPPWPA